MLVNWVDGNVYDEGKLGWVNEVLREMIICV